MYLRTLIAAVAVAASAGFAFADDHVEEGAKVFKKNCFVCHDVTGKNKVGPTLKGVVGRAVATVPDFKYSDAMKTFGEGKTWTEEELAAYLPKPKDLVPGTKMAFVGLKSPEDIANLIAFLKEQK